MLSAIGNNDKQVNAQDNRLDDRRGRLESIGRGVTGINWKEVTGINNRMTGRSVPKKTLSRAYAQVSVKTGSF